LILKKNKRHIIYTWIVLICFVAGQTMVSAHQHHTGYAVHNIHHTPQNQQTVTEKCQLCDAMHHNSMLLTDSQHFTPAIATVHFYTPGQYDFVSIALILSSGRAPPIS
jgi:hypothetical protein